MKEIRCMLFVSVLLIAAGIVGVHGVEITNDSKVSHTANISRLILSSTSTYPVVVGKYEQKVLIEGKWGEGSKEFGELENWEEGLTKIEPTSLCVNSQGDIYILDLVNNRIMKYDKSGKYLISIEVPAMLSKEKKPFKSNDDKFLSRMYYEGINIITDSKDRLYYCYRKGKCCEIWQFENDVLKKKWSLPFACDSLGLMIDGDDNVFVYNNRGIYDIFRNIQKKFEVGGYMGKNVVVTIDRSMTESENVIKVTIMNKQSDTIIKEIVYTNERGKHVWLVPILKGRQILLAHGWNPNGTSFIDTFSEKGDLISSRQIPDGDVIPTQSSMDTEGNIYQIQELVDSSGMKIIKWTR